MFLLKGIIIGLIIGTPVGAVGALCVSRTLQYGRKCGFLTGFGCSVADCLYAAVGVFGLSAVSAFLAAHDMMISLAGGTIVTAMGVSALFKKGNMITAMKERQNGAKMFLSSFVIGITNPAVLIISMVAFSYFEIPDGRTLWQNMVLIAGFFIGTTLWWFILIGIVRLIHRRYGNNIGNNINKVFGVIMIVLGFVVFGRIIFRE